MPERINAHPSSQNRPGHRLPLRSHHIILIIEPVFLCSHHCVDDSLSEPMVELAQRETMTSPLNFEWSEDFMNPQTKFDILDPFVEGNEGSLGSDDQSEVSRMSKSDLLRNGDDASEPITLESRKRSSSSSSPSSEIAGTRRKKKPKGMPKRPLSAYNLFFQAERSKIQEAAEESGERIGFEGLGKIIGKKWKELKSVERKMYDKMAETDTGRYRKEMEAYNELRTNRMKEEDRIASSNPSAVATLAHKTSEPSVYAYENASFLQHLAPTHQHDPFMVASSAQSVSMTSREEFLRLHALTTPHTSSLFNPQHQHHHQLSNRASLENNMASARYQSHYDVAYQGGPVPHATHQVSMPLPPQNAEPVAPPSSFQMPPGMEIVLSDRTGQDRKFCVQYTCYSMTRDAARKYIDGWTGAVNGDRKIAPSMEQYHQTQNIGMTSAQKR